MEAALTEFVGTPSDDVPGVLAEGVTDVTAAVVSMSARDPGGRDAGYIEWHSLDHRPEQHRLRDLRGSLRLVSTPSCRAARAVSAEPYDAVDHVMTYLFADRAALEPFYRLGQALFDAGRMPWRLPRVEVAVCALEGKAAAPRVVAGADVVPWRPALGAYLLIEEGAAAAADLVDVPGVAGAWWFAGTSVAMRAWADATGKQVTLCFLDDDPVAVSDDLRDALERRWSDGTVTPLLAAPFHTITPFEWGRHLP